MVIFIQFKSTTSQLKTSREVALYYINDDDCYFLFIMLSIQLPALIVRNQCLPPEIGVYYVSPLAGIVKLLKQSVINTIISLGLNLSPSSSFHSLINP